MLVGIHRVGFAGPTNEGAIQTPVVLFYLENNDIESFVEQLEYLADIQTPVLIQQSLVDYFKSDSNPVIAARPYRTFIADREAAMLFKLKFALPVRIDTNMWLIPRDAEIKRILLNK